MYKTIGIVAHVDAGKTTFSEQLLYHTESIRQRGRVDHQDAFLDSHMIERSRGITVFADQANFSFRGSSYSIIDTPGHVDFSPEMERALQVMDAAILLINAADGVEGHTETVWRLLTKDQIPTFFFLNKVDREGVDRKAMIDEIRTSFSADIFDMAWLSDGILSEELIEFIAERDEQLVESYVNGEYDEALWIESMQKMIRNREIFPYAFGSALKDIGVLEFLMNLDTLTVTDYTETKEFAANVYKIRHDENGQRVTYMKITQGSLKVRDEIQINDSIEKVTEIRMYNGSRYKTVDRARAGELVAVMGLTVAAGDAVGNTEGRATFDLVPTLLSKVIFDSSLAIQDMLKYFNMLDAEDPSLQVVWNEEVKEIHVHVMGVIQLEVLQQVMKERFHVDIAFGNPNIVYRETIRSTVRGYGHFEPLKHYAEVHLEMEPAVRGSGISFANESHVNDLSLGHQRLIRHHIFERAHRGLLTGSSLTDMKITLLTGRGHNEHTSGGDFREATLRAIRQGLEKADNLLLEPMYLFKIKVELHYVGRVLSDIQQACGSFDAPEIKGDKTIITGRVPVAKFMNYTTIFASFTSGKGSLSLQFGGYAECHNTQAVIEEIGYDKNADSEYTSSSIFCAKGKGYSVPWDEAEVAMHLSLI